MTEVIKILLVEDDEDDYFLTSDYLAQCESPTFELTWVTNSGSAVEALKANRFDLCLLDYLLGSENAIDVLGVLKANQINLPVVILTGQSDARVDELVMRAGAADYLQKSEIETPRFMRTIRYAMVRRDIENEKLERSKVEQKNKAKDKFLAHLGHELRTPLTSILGYTELLLDDVQSNPYQQELSIIHSNGKHLLSLLNDLLDMSRIMAEKLELNIKEVNLSAFLIDINSLMRLDVKDKGLSLHLVARTPIPEFIQTDPTRLRQVLLNLISNAIKFTDTGSITLFVEQFERKNHSPALRFTVEDTGIGMPADKLKNIFKPFEQIEDVMRANHGGAGLGLAICKELVGKLGGDINVTSTLGAGSTFTFDINPGDITKQPYVELSLNQTMSIESRSTKIDVGGKVLVVDDLREIRRLTGHLVSQSGAEVSYAENGVKALEAALESEERHQPFDLILMDIHMPVMNGLEALQGIRRHGSKIPVVAVTAASRKGLKASLLRDGFNDVIEKPIDRLALAKVLTRFLASHSSSSEKFPQGITTRVSHSGSELGEHYSKVNDRKSDSHKESNNTTKKHILVVEDDEDSAQLLQLFLCHFGHTVHIEHCGEDAIKATELDEFNHILMDLTLPDYKGYDLAKALKARQPRAEITIVSGHEANPDLMRTIGIDHALLKPVSKEDLAAVLDAN
ncbi:MAG: hybrid sensor histidine kinase/response regulator [Alteromonas sp. Nap_26]|nr:MAG: hybrid sensor histidine kinase/response regulator [Alteromonas sp. Nap_26]